MNEVMRLFPEKMKQALNLQINGRWKYLEEIRFRLNQPIELIFYNNFEWLEMRPSKNDFNYVINQLSAYSLYRMEEELREGFITINGGHRVGLAGKVITNNGMVKQIKHITFLNIRIAKEVIGIATSLIPYLYLEDRCLNTLIVGSPQTGKTTLIRDLSRLIGSGWGKKRAKKVGIIDERSEIAASLQGVPQHNVGWRTDVMDACPKAEGMMMMIRSMSPDVLIVDEIGSKRDVATLMEALNAGVAIICTIHGQSLAQLKKRPSLKELFSKHVFKRIILLEKKHHARFVNKVYDEREIEIYSHQGVLRK